MNPRSPWLPVLVVHWLMRISEDPDFCLNVTLQYLCAQIPCAVNTSMSESALLYQRGLLIPNQFWQIGNTISYLVQSRQIFLLFFFNLHVLFYPNTDWICSTWWVLAVVHLHVTAIRNDIPDVNISFTWEFPGVPSQSVATFHPKATFWFLLPNVGFTFPWASHKWNHTECTLGCLAFFTQHDAFTAHPYCM